MEGREEKKSDRRRGGKRRVRKKRKGKGVERVAGRMREMKQPTKGEKERGKGRREERTSKK